MTNIWDFFLQTMEVSLTALLLLFIKWIFTDKLSPRWQYGVWILLAGKLLIPAGSSGHFMSRFVTAHLEGAKAAAEDGLHSAYTQVFAPIGDMAAVIPWLRAKPVSVTDWLFVLYAAGVLLCITGYLCSYVRLRRHLRKGEPVSAALAEKIRRTGETGGLRTCPAVRIEGVPSAFICGVFRPVMAVPAETENLDEKIILHELLHLNYLDGLQSIFWSLMRALHWCNPFVQYVMNRIGNDMESLCDQRVLEKLTGESRREYGQILLSMTNEKYARVPGTTSISNGGKNIARRIAAIARFKQYPRGMALASVCIVLILAVPAFAGASDTVLDESYPSQSQSGLHQKVAEARLNRCSTMAGAIDTWTKGMVFNQPLYLAAASPVSDQKGIFDGIKEKRDFSAGVNHMQETRGVSGYEVYNLQKIGKDRYRALIVLSGHLDEDEKIPMLALPVIAAFEDGWTVTGDGTPQWVKVTPSFGIRGNDKLPYLTASAGKGKTGRVSVKEQLQMTVTQQPAAETEAEADDFFAEYFDDDLYGTEGNMNNKADPAAEFDLLYVCYAINYQSSQSLARRQKVRDAYYKFCTISTMKEEPEWQFDEADMNEDGYDVRGDNQAYARVRIKGIWDGRIAGKAGTEAHFDGLEDLPDYAGYALDICQNGKTVETIKVKRGEGYDQ